MGRNKKEKKEKKEEKEEKEAPSQTKEQKNRETEKNIWSILKPSQKGPQADHKLFLLIQFLHKICQSLTLKKGAMGRKCRIIFVCRHTNTLGKNLQILSKFAPTVKYLSFSKTT